MKKSILFGLSLILVLLLSGCQSLDVIGNGSVTAFESMLAALPEAPQEKGGDWSLSAPDGGARFVWGATDGYDAYLSVDAAPFVAAGLDVALLPDSMVQGDQLVMGVKLDGVGSAATPTSTYEQIVLSHRERIGHHSAMDHFGIDLDGGNMFEWARDMSTNDKDIVFVLGPEPFQAAGADLNQIEGWVIAAVDTMDTSGRKIQVEKLLKPFDLK